MERYIEGKEVTTFWLFRDGEIYLTALGNRHVKHNQEGVIPLPVAYTFPSVYLDKYQREVVPRVKEMLRSIGIKNGMMFMQCLVEDGNCIVYDIGYRLTGSLEYKLLDKVCGYNPLDMMIKFALTGSMYEGDLEALINPDFDQYAANITFLVKPGVIGKIIGVEEIKKVPGVIDAVLAHVEGDEIPESAIGTLKQIVLRAFAVAETKEELAKIIDKVHGLFHVYSDKGEDMLLSKFDIEEMENVVK